MADQTREVYHSGDPQLDMILQRIADRLDKIEGLRDTFDFDI